MRFISVQLRYERLSKTDVLVTDLERIVATVTTAFVYVLVTPAKSLRMASIDTFRRLGVHRGSSTRAFTEETPVAGPCKIYDLRTTRAAREANLQRVGCRGMVLPVNRHLMDT